MKTLQTSLSQVGTPTCNAERQGPVPTGLKKKKNNGIWLSVSRDGRMPVHYLQSMELVHHSQKLE